MNIDINKIAKEVTEEINNINVTNNAMKIPVEASAKHIHLSKEHIDYLFGENYNLKEVRKLSQVGQFLSAKRVRLIGPKNVMDNIAVLGPNRKESQVEVSKTDAVFLGINPPLRESGDTLNSESIYIAYGNKMLHLKEGVIIAKNHIHMNEDDAKKFNVSDGDEVKVKILSKRSVVFENVRIRVRSDFTLNFHIDYDEANAVFYEKGTSCIIVN